MPIIEPSGADTRDLCSVDDVKALMQKSGANAANQDSLIQTLITRASVKIMRDVGRELVPGGPEQLPFSQATRTFEYPWAEQYPGEALVDLRPFDLMVTQSQPIVVAVDTDQSSDIVLTTDLWRLWPQPPQFGVFIGLKVFPLDISVGIVGWDKRQLQVTADWGFPSIPFEATQACAETVIHWLTAYPAMRAATQVDLATAPVTPRTYPMAAVDLLGCLRRMTV